MNFKYGSMLLNILLLAILCSCNKATEEQAEENQILANDNLAMIVGVECTGQPNNYTLSVSIQSPDTGCDQYADWWEVFTPDSTLIYRRILAHSHVDEQPFTRSGGIVDIGALDFIYVRAHMNNTGYGSQVYSGNVSEGLVQDSLPITYAIGLETTAPLPEDCAF